MKRLLAALALTLLPSLALAQGAVQQVGPATKFDPTGFIGDHQIESASKMFNDNARGLNPAHTFDNKGQGSCWEDALTSGPYHQVCITHDSAGNALLTTTPQNGATGSSFNISINGSIYPVGGTPGGNVTGPTPTVTGDVACWNNTLGTLLSDCGTAANPIANSLMVGNATGGGYSPTGPIAPVAMVSAVGAKNGFIGQINNNVPFNTNPFLPVGVTGYGKIPAGTASVVYGLYGLAELYNPNGSAVAGEVTARNFSGANAAVGPIPPVSQPATYPTAVGLQVTCGTQTGGSDCSLGMMIDNEAGGDPTKPSFDTGATIYGFRHYGLYIDPHQTSGSQIGAHIANSGSGINLELQTTGTMTPGNAVLAVYDSGGLSRAGIFQNGDFHGNNLTMNGVTQLLPALPSAGGGGGLFVCIDSTGLLYKKATCP